MTLSSGVALSERAEQPPGFSHGDKRSFSVVLYGINLYNTSHVKIQHPVQIK
jgi:hypothetical protein